ncbi:ABC transporter ATP-binding protein [Escherichia coli]|uniref:ABC transporter ATP-binding protein n=1 Tax=Escherichia coli TaxID=562 RepID=A0A376MUS2_ECOLX|nr:ABC transporter ATP-binding protein [Escherichia coli]
MSLISMHGAWLSFSDAPLLDNAELHIEDNERVVWWAATAQANRR